MACNVMLASLEATKLEYLVLTTFPYDSAVGETKKKKQKEK